MLSKSQSDRNQNLNQAGSKSLTMPGQKELFSIENLAALPTGIMDDTVRGAAKYCQIGHHAAESLLVALTDARFVLRSPDMCQIKCNMPEYPVLAI